ncbi:radical SAM protein [Asaia siamensis]|uniref:SPL family radical SAM protein n=1 Tax=Asaia siamensis TaxID=110479 RepID=UPI001665010D|nr:radical SAM protein [Asaia siamensis]
MEYKYYLALTSQLPFCSVPLRIDTYSSCQFSCSYCFSKARGGSSLAKSNQEISPSQLEKRLHRVSRGRISGAVDEFLSRRIPVQLGGMNDPFSPWEREKRRTLETLKVLRDFHYPTLISTKNTMLAEEPYLEILQDGNFLVRISATAGSSDTRVKLEKGVPLWEARLKAAEKLSSKGVPVSFRFQPIVYDENEHVISMIRSAGSSGVRHISAEYLKLPIEKSSRQASYLARSFPNMADTYRQNHARQVGRELVLSSSAKAEGLYQLRAETIRNEMLFGFAENEFLHLNTFQSCCNAADQFLENANFFSSNILGIIKRQLNAEKITFHLPDNFWVPTNSVFSHLNSRSRGKEGSDTGSSPRERWIKLLQDKWNSKSERGGPSGFWGISDLGEVDRHGNKIFSMDQKAMIDF